MSMKSFLFAAFLLIGVGLLNQSAFRVMETEKAILLEFGNLIDADIKPGLHLNCRSRKRSKSLMPVCSRWIPRVKLTTR